MKNFLFLFLFATATALAGDERTAVEAQTSALRGLKFQRAVNYRMMARAEFREFLLKKVREQFTDQELRDYGRSLAALGAIPEGTDLLAVMLSLYDEQVAAFYVPEERALYTFKDATWTGAIDRMLLSHELVHALQDQNFDLTMLPLKVKDNDDLALATAALLEGDAMLVMTRFYAENADPAKLLGDVGAMLGQNTAKLQDAPAFLRDTLLFPYLHGQQFVAALPAGELNGAFRRLPVSTKQILHPELYRAGKGIPVGVTVPQVTAAGWRQIGNNVLGEFGIRALLEPHVGAFAAQMAATGWSGDRYQVYERGTNGPTGVVWATAWESAEDAEEFAETFAAVAAKRGVTARVHREGTRVVVVQSADRSFGVE